MRKVYALTTPEARLVAAFTPSLPGMHLRRSIAEVAETSNEERASHLIEVHEIKLVKDALIRVGDGEAAMYPELLNSVTEEDRERIESGMWALVLKEATG